MEHKILEFKLDDLTEDGTFSGYASVFNIIDAGGDMVKPGAFRKTLREKKKTFPMLWSHDSRDPIGTITAEEDDHGLQVRGRLTRGVRRADETYLLMKDKVVTGLSIGYDAVKREFDEAVRILKEINLWEVSPCVFPMLDVARISDVKSRGADGMKPFPNEHSARLRDPDDFAKDTFRRKSDGTIFGKIKVPETAAVIWAKLKDAADDEDPPHAQAVRFPVADWSVADAKKWLKDNAVKYVLFETAEESAARAIIELASRVERDRYGFNIEDYRAVILQSADGLKSLVTPAEPPKIGDGTLAGETDEPTIPDGIDPEFKALIESLADAAERYSKSLGGKVGP